MAAQAGKWKEGTNERYPVGGDSGMLGFDPERLCQYFFELAPVDASGDQFLALRVSGPNPPLLCWRLRQDVSAFAEKQPTSSTGTGLRRRSLGTGSPSRPISKDGGRRERQRANVGPLIYPHTHECLQRPGCDHHRGRH